MLWLYAPNEYAELNRVKQEKKEPVPGLGDEAVRFLDSGDGRHKLRARPRQLALERFDR